MHDSYISLKSNLGTKTVKNGDLHNIDARESFITGLCAELALNIHEKTHQKIYLVTSDLTLTKTKLDNEFSLNPVSIFFNAQHFIIKNNDESEFYLDAYGKKHINDLRELFETELSIIETSEEMVKHFCKNNDYKKYELFAETAIRFYENNTSYPY